MIKQLNPFVLWIGMLLFTTLVTLGTHIGSKIWNKDGADSNAIAGQLGDSAGFAGALLNGTSVVFVIATLREELKERELERKRKLTMEVFSRFYTKDYADAFGKVYKVAALNNEVDAKQPSFEDSIEAVFAEGFVIANIKYATTLVVAKEIDFSLARSLGNKIIEEAMSGSFTLDDRTRRASEEAGSFGRIASAFRELKTELNKCC